MSCPRFQWIDVIPFKWDWKVKTQESASLRAIRVICDSDNHVGHRVAHSDGQESILSREKYIRKTQN